MDTIKARSGFGDERYEKVEFQSRVRDQYLKFIEMHTNSPNWVSIEANNKSIEEMHAEIT